MKYLGYDKYITDVVVPDIESVIEWETEKTISSLYIDILALCLLIYIQLPPSRDEEGYRGETGYDRFIDYLGEHASMSAAILSPFVFRASPECLSDEMSRKLQRNWWRLKQLIETGKFYKYYKKDRKMFKKVLTDLGLETLYIAIMSERDKIEEKLWKRIREGLEALNKSLEKMKIISDSLKNNTLKELTKFPPKI